jgi:hypothetical protein
MWPIYARPKDLTNMLAIGPAHAKRKHADCTEPSDSAGGGISSNRAGSCFPGATVIARKIIAIRPGAALRSRLDRCNDPLHAYV